MSEMLVHVLIQTVTAFEIQKTYRGFCIFLSMKVCTLRLCRLEVSTRSQNLIKVLCEQTRELNKCIKIFFGLCLMSAGLKNIVVDFHI